MSTRRQLSVKKPVKLIFAGGFLGSGKTTALAALAKRLIERGMRVGFITNDQSENLADTIIVRQMLAGLGVPVEEVVKGCFCCKFDDLVATMSPGSSVNEPSSASPVAGRSWGPLEDIAVQRRLSGGPGGSGDSAHRQPATSM